MYFSTVEFGICLNLHLKKKDKMTKADALYMSEVEDAAHEQLDMYKFRR